MSVFLRLSGRGCRRWISMVIRRGSRRSVISRVDWWAMLGPRHDRPLARIWILAAIAAPALAWSMVGAPAGRAISRADSLGQPSRAQMLHRCLARAARLPAGRRTRARSACLRRYGRTPGRSTGLLAGAPERLTSSLRGPTATIHRPPVATWSRSRSGRFALGATRPRPDSVRRRLSDARPYAYARDRDRLLRNGLYALGSCGWTSSAAQLLVRARVPRRRRPIESDLSDRRNQEVVSTEARDGCVARGG